MKIENVHTVFISEKTVKFYEFAELLKEVKDIEKVILVKPDLVLLGTEKATNVTFKKPRTCEVRRKEGVVRCE